MKKRDTLFTFLIVGVFLFSFVSAGWFSDTWNFITGHVTADPNVVITHPKGFAGIASGTLIEDLVLPYEKNIWGTYFCTDGRKNTKYYINADEFVKENYFIACSGYAYSLLDGAAKCSGTATTLDLPNAYYPVAGSNDKSSRYMKIYPTMDVYPSAKKDSYGSKITYGEKELGKGFCVESEVQIKTSSSPSTYNQDHVVYWVSIPDNFEYKCKFSEKYTCNDWSACTNGVQTQECNGDCLTKKVETKSCMVAPPICTSFIYSEWSICANGQQTRTVTSSSPSGCTGGTQESLSQSCIVTPVCIESDWNFSLSPSTCPSSGQQIKTWVKISSQCVGGVIKPSSETISCTYVAPMAVDNSYILTNGPAAQVIKNWNMTAEEFNKTISPLVFNMSRVSLNMTKDQTSGLENDKYKAGYFFGTNVMSGDTLNVIFLNYPNYIFSSSKSLSFRYFHKFFFLQGAWYFDWNAAASRSFCTGESDKIRLDNSNNITIYSKMDYQNGGNLVNQRVVVDASQMGQGFCLPVNLKIYHHLLANNYNEGSQDVPSAVWVKMDCESQCLEQGLKQCSGEGYRTCQKHSSSSSDYCFGWSPVTSCEAGSTCSMGNCVRACNDSDWSSQMSSDVCPVSGQLTKTWNKIGTCSGGVSHEATETVSCVYQAPQCVYQYSEYGACASTGFKTRTIVSQGPENCQGNPSLTDSCIYVPTCNEDNWQNSTENCSVEGKQLVSWTQKGVCEGGVSHSNETISCTYQAPECVYAYSFWSECKPSGTMNRNSTLASSGNCVGAPNISESCSYVPVCVTDQIKVCTEKENALASGYADKCLSDGSGWKEENTCNYSCKTGFVSVSNSCVKEEEKVLVQTSFNETSVDISSSGSSFLVKDKLNQSLIKVSSGVSKLDMVKDVSNGKSFVIVKNLTLTGNELLKKTIYLKRNNQNSNGVCFADRDNIKSSDDISNNCTKMLCPGTLGDYKCSIEGDSLAISGLSHSGVIEAYLFCGDGICSQNEGCVSCSKDCGKCSSSGSSGLSSLNNNSLSLNVSKVVLQNLSQSEINNLMNNLGTLDNSGETKSFAQKIIEFLNLSNAPTNEKIKRIFIILGVVFGILIFLAIIGILINKIVNRTRSY